MKNLWRNHCYAIILVCLAMGTTVALAFNSDNKYEEMYISITVNEGETLWGLSKQYVNDHEMSEIEFVAWVEKTNKVDGDTIKAGESLIIPVKVDSIETTELASN